MTTAVYLEVGQKRVFACALDWPGWCRSGKDEEQALEALRLYLPRYAPVVKGTGLHLPARGADKLEVVERVPGSATTDFGAPGAVGEDGAKPLTKKAAERRVALVAASWKVFDKVVKGAPASLRKGPGGGGRDRDKMVDHVLGAESVYARKIGVRHPQPALGDTKAIDALRDEIVSTLSQASDGAPYAEKGWPARYAGQRIAWHVLDHAWEIEDRSD